MNDKFKTGYFFTYECENEETQHTLRISGSVVYKNRTYAIIKVAKKETEFPDVIFTGYDIFSYDEISVFFPDFVDPNNVDESEYMCLDVETELLKSFDDLQGELLNETHQDDIQPSNCLNLDLPF